MRKVMVLLATMVFILVSCSRDEVVEIKPQNGISFENMYVDHSTRAVETNIENLSEFHVHGIRKDSNGNELTVFDNVRVYRLGEKPNYTYTYDDKRYWFDGTYDFIALNAAHSADDVLQFVPGGQNLYSKASLTYKNSRVDDPESGKTDLISATAHRVVSANASIGTEPVTLTFKHLLAEVAFEITNSLGSVYELEIPNEGLALNAQKEAVYHYENAKWEYSQESALGDGRTKMSFVSTPLVIPGNPGALNAHNNVVLSDSRFIFPTPASANSQHLYPYASINVKENGNLATVLNFSNHFDAQGSGLDLQTTLLSGHKYLFKLEVTPESINAKTIEFSVEQVESFTNGGSASIK